MSKYSTIILEAFCTRTWDIRGQKFWHEIIDFVTYETKKVPNKSYDPKYKTPKKPSYCPMKKGESPTYACLENGCTHLGYGDAEEKEYRWDSLYWKLTLRGIYEHVFKY